MGAGVREVLRHRGARGQSAAADDEDAEPMESTASSGCGSLTAFCPNQHKGKLLMAEKAGVRMDAVRHAMEYMAQRTGKRLTGHKANYGDATPEDVARAMLMKNRAPFKPSKKGKE